MIKQNLGLGDDFDDVTLKLWVESYFIYSAGGAICCLGRIRCESGVAIYALTCMAKQ